MRRAGIPMLARRAALALLAAAPLLLAMGSAEPAAAENRLLKVVGAVPVGTGRAPRMAPRDAAILEAQREAVYQVARELLIDSELAEDPDLELGQVLGKDMVRYTTRFRILEDRGEEAMAVRHPSGATREYVVLVEALVDAARVRDRLETAGLLARANVTRSENSVVIRVDGLRLYGAYEALREALVAGAGARSVLPEQLAHERALLRVETEDDPRDLLDKLLSSAPPELEIQPVAVDGGRLHLRVEWQAPPASPGEERRF